MRLSWPWAIATGVLVGGLAAWWAVREPPERQRDRELRAERAAAANARDARPSLYRWEDANGTVHYTDTPPSGRKYTRVDRTPRDGIEVHGNRQ